MECGNGKADRANRFPTTEGVVACRRAKMKWESGAGLRGAHVAAILRSVFLRFLPSGIGERDAERCFFIFAE